MTESFVESGMNFGPFEPGRCFRIEASQVYGDLNAKGAGIAVAELLWLHEASPQPVVWLVEAKSSSPRPGNSVDFDSFVKEIRRKLADSLSLFLAIRLRRHGEALDELPEPFRTFDLQAVDFQLVLVVKGHRPEWLPPLNDKLSAALRALVKIWRLSPTAVTVLNDDLARKRGLIQ